MNREYANNENNKHNNENKTDSNEPDSACNESDYDHKARACYELIYLLKQSKLHLRPQIEILEGVVTRAHHQLTDLRTVALSSPSPTTSKFPEIPSAWERALRRIETAYQCLLALNR